MQLARLGKQKITTTTTPSLLSLWHICLIFTLCVSTSTLTLIRGEESESESETTKKNKKKKVAIIGGGVGGSFTAKFISDYDKGCSTIDSITIYEPYSIISNYGDGESKSNDTNTIIPYEYEYEYEEEKKANSQHQHQQQNKKKHRQQGPRTASVQLSDGTIVELGASILFNGNKLAVEMLENDDSLVAIEPLSGNDQSSSDEKKEGMGIYNGKITPASTGEGEEEEAAAAKLVWPLYTSNMTKEETTKAMLWRYNLDLYRIDKATNKALASFEKIYDLLETGKDETGEEFAYKSPNDLWAKVGLKHAALTSLDDFLDEIGVAKDYVPWWKRFLLGSQGLVRDELFAPMNICNNNKNNAQMTGKNKTRII